MKAGAEPSDVRTGGSVVECESICGLRTGLIVAKKDAYGVEMSMNKRETTACQYNCFRL